MSRISGSASYVSYAIKLASIDVTIFCLRFMLAMVLSMRASSSSRIGSYSRRYLYWIASNFIIWSSCASSIVRGGKDPLDLRPGDIAEESLAANFEAWAVFTFFGRNLSRSEPLSLVASPSDAFWA